MVHEQRAENAQCSESNTSMVQELRNEVAAVAGAVNMLFGRLNELSAELDDPKKKLQAEVAAIANVVRKLAERVDRVERADRIDRGHKEPRSPDFHARDQAEARQRMSPHQHGRHFFDTSGDETDILRPRTTANLPSRDIAQHGEPMQMRRNKDQPKGEPPNSPKAAASTCGSSPQDGMSSSKKTVPDPRNWLNEPLSVSVARFDADYPTSLQSTLQTAPNLGSAEFIRRASADRR